MPLTFAHPAAILPFTRKSKYINFSALVIGSMAPDFEYFLKGRPMGEIGHTFNGFVLFNLPLVTFIYFIYHIFVHQILFNHLPSYLQDPYVKKIDSTFGVKIVVFCYSALFGMLTHVVWDSFTHINGYVVLKFPALFTHGYSMYGFTISLYKLLQHGSTLFGLTMILVYMYYRALSQRKHNDTPVSSKHKLVFWSTIFLLTGLFVFIWYLISTVSIISYGILVVRIIDSFFLSLFLISMLIKYVRL
ncbi:DUF4184 family protein [Sporosarcina sp. E16_3]|uniref:DUF4184 family protein n=1 Tax=Sporosarcina sp. E16_3 TaxID=2789293 RepID=UPI001A9281A7|nr:DUF4184 family protein [Sporosarcina sp. E16_3]MBO0603260.1 DUF4184 family protein [Sporosarcina sp. E16_3]